jgi:hypothetical protein
MPSSSSPGLCARAAAAISRSMSDRVFFSLAALVTVLMIALAMVWPQGLGARSPGPFGHPVVQPADAERLALARATAAKIAANPRAAATIAGLRAGR